MDGVSADTVDIGESSDYDKILELFMPSESAKDAAVKAVAEVCGMELSNSDIDYGKFFDEVQDAISVCETAFNKIEQKCNLFAEATSIDGHLMTSAMLTFNKAHLNKEIAIAAAKIISRLEGRNHQESVL